MPPRWGRYTRLHEDCTKAAPGAARASVAAVTRILAMVLGLAACNRAKSNEPATGSGSAARAEIASPAPGDAAVTAAPDTGGAHAGDVAYVADETGLVE